MSDGSEEMERDIGILRNYTVEKGLLVESCIEEHLLIPSPSNMTVPSRNISIRTSNEIGEIESPIGTSPDAAAAEIETLEEMIGEEVGENAWQTLSSQWFLIVEQLCDTMPATSAAEVRDRTLLCDKCLCPL